jgi:hypothetical protein
MDTLENDLCLFDLGHTLRKYPGTESVSASQPVPPVVNDQASSSCITATATTTSAMNPNNDTLGERLRLYVEENFHDA